MVSCNESPEKKEGNTEAADAADGAAAPVAATRQWPRNKSNLAQCDYLDISSNNKLTK